ncbi:MAG TPA: hypothetical protein VF142_15380 [Longimicrobium sp.]
MLKLKLDLDRLVVESFDTIAADGVKSGTVDAFQVSVVRCLISVDAPTCPDTCADTCDFSCTRTQDYTCPNTCGNTCDDASCNTCLTNCGQMSCVEVCP